jgi:hypothetical protein
VLHRGSLQSLLSNIRLGLKDFSWLRACHIVWGTKRCFTVVIRLGLEYSTRACRRVGCHKVLHWGSIQSLLSNIRLESEGTLWLRAYHRVWGTIRCFTAVIRLGLEYYTWPRVGYHKVLHWGSLQSLLSNIRLESEGNLWLSAYHRVWGTIRCSN